MTDETTASTEPQGAVVAPVVTIPEVSAAPAVEEKPKATRSKEPKLPEGAVVLSSGSTYIPSVA